MIEIISLSVNKTNQIEVVYTKEYTDERGYLKEMQEGRVWSPTDDIASDTLSGAHPDVKKLATTYWTPEVVTAYSANLIAQANAERDKQQAAITEAAAKKAEAEAAANKEIEDSKARETAANEAKALAEAAEAAAKEAQAKAEQAKAASDAALKAAQDAADALAAQEKAAAEKAAFDAAVAAAVAAQLAPVEVAA